MLHRVLLVEKLPDESIEVTWKFPTENKPELADLLKQRLEFLWREQPIACSHVSRTENVWQCAYFGSDFGVIVEASDRPSNGLHRIVAALAFNYEKERDLTRVASSFITEKLSFDVTMGGGDKTDLEQIRGHLLSVLSAGDCALVLTCIAKGGRVCLRGGSSGELYRLALVLVGLGSIELHPLVLGPTQAELDELQTLGAYICCQPSEDALEEKSSGIFWDIKVDLRMPVTVTVRKLSMIPQGESTGSTE
jgi:hypothetical protein